jgi:hypothetical protein
LDPAQYVAAYRSAFADPPLDIPSRSVLSICTLDLYSRAILPFCTLSFRCLFPSPSPSLPFPSPSPPRFETTWKHLPGLELWGMTMSR